MMAMVLELGLAGPLSGEGILLVILPGFSPYPHHQPSLPTPLPALQSPLPSHRLTQANPACHTLNARTGTGKT